jgi:hypothetical protein
MKKPRRYVDPARFKRASGDWARKAVPSQAAE